MRRVMLAMLAAAGCTSDTVAAAADGTSTGSDMPSTGAQEADASTSETSSSTESSVGDTSSGSTSAGEGSSSSSGEETVEANIAFVTSQAWPPAELGGLAGADERCQAAAEAAGLPANTYLAWLATSDSAPYGPGRLEGARGWVRPDGRPFADLLDDLVDDGPLWYLLRLDEHGNDVGPVHVPAGTPPLMAGPTEMCGDWTTDDLSDVWGAYNSRSGWDWWAALLLTDACDDPRRLFCFGADLTNPVDPPDEETGRTAFLSTPYTVTAGGGLAAADAHCAAEASAAGLTGEFAALLPTATGSAASRFDLDGEGWVRPDGLWFIEDPHALDGGVPDLPLEIRADGTRGTLGPVRDHFTGAASPSETCTACCDDWTNPAATTYASETNTTEYRWYTDDWSVNCTSAFALLCLER